jgi:hypothetical protein
VGWLTIFGVCTFALVLCLRLKARQARPVQSTLRQRLRLARILALMAECGRTMPSAEPDSRFGSWPEFRVKRSTIRLRAS